MGQDDKTREEEVEELKLRLQEARKAREAAEEKRRKRWEAADLQAEIENETRAAEEQEKLEELEDEHGRAGEKIWRIDTSLGMIVVKRPSPAKYRGFVDKGKHNQNAQESLVHEFLLYPDKKRFNTMVMALPGLVTRCCDAIIYLGGWREREEAAGK